jgi:putative toxin-antitoxin system antitoxin component (TIGR02293 family)
MGTSAALALHQKFLPVEALLGGRKVLQVLPRSTLDWVSLIRHGIPAAALESLTRSIQVSQSELAAALGIPERTLARRKREGMLSSDESAKLVRLARVVERAEEVFEDLDIALNWLKAPNAALSGITPLSLLDTEIGAESVTDTLGRIEHGVFA